MDLAILLAGTAVAGAVFLATLAVQGRLSETRDAVQARILDGGGRPASQGSFQLIVPSVASLSERGRRMALDLEQAGLAFTLTEFLIIRTMVGVVFAITVVLLTSSFGGQGAVNIGAALIGFLLGYLLPSNYVKRRKARRLRLIEDQLLEALVSMSKSLRAGVGLSQAMEYAGRESSEPLGPELLRVVRELQLGADLEVVLEDMNQRIASPDLEIVSSAVVIQRRVGGNLSEILNNTANTIRERKAIRNELHALTAKQRLQGNASALIPVFIAVFFFFVNHDVGKLLFTTTAGNIALAVGIFFELLGIWMVRRFSSIEV